MITAGHLDIRPTFFEFFAGGGMARAGLGAEWNCVFANDFSREKARAYTLNWGGDHLICGDVAHLTVRELPGCADLVWASFPCQDLSVAGNYLGLGDETSSTPTRSGTFWPFWALMLALKKDGRLPRIIVLENVIGILTSRQGADFKAICQALAGGGYRYGAVVIDAKEFVPQSRQRIFFVAVAEEIAVPSALSRATEIGLRHPPALLAAHNLLEGQAAHQWVWWNLPGPLQRSTGLEDIIEEHPTGCRWHSLQETHALLAMMTPLHLAKIEEARASGRKQVGGVYKRTRLDADRTKRQRAEVRFDDLLGCLRTPTGGSSRQTILVVEGCSIRSRLLSPREAARLMGLDDSYKLPARYNDAYHLAGDGVCVPVVRYLAAQLLEPIITAARSASCAIAA